MKYVHHCHHRIATLTHQQWILGNTFPFVVFTSFGAFWLGYGATLVPSYGAFANYADPTIQGDTGLESVGFNVGIGKSCFSTHRIRIADAGKLIS